MCLVFILVLSVPQTAVHANTYTVTNTDNGGLGSLRQAIADANANTGADVVRFNIPTATDPKCGLYLPGVCTIELSSALVISDNNTYIYGNTQSANQGDTNPDGLEIEVRGMTRTFPVFTITSDGNILSFMSITGGSIGVQINGDSNSNTLNTNTIGLDADMATKVPNGTEFKFQREAI